MDKEMIKFWSHDSDWLAMKCNAIAREKGLPEGKVEKTYFGVEDNKRLRIIVAGNRYELCLETGIMRHKP